MFFGRIEMVIVMLEKEGLENALVVCPNDIKKEILKKKKTLIDTKFMTKEEYKNRYFFSYTNQTLDYLMEKYGYLLEVARMMVEELYVIDLEKTYQSSKLLKLQEIKRDLVEKGYLIFDFPFRKYIEKKEIIVYGYYTLDQYEEEMFQKATILKEKKGKINHIVTCCETLEEEVIFVLEKITELYQKGVPLSKIYLANVTSEYHYSIKTLFEKYPIPIELDRKDCIYGTNIVKEYLKSGTLPGFTNEVVVKLIDVVNSLVEVKSSKHYQEFLIDKLKNTYLPSKKYKNAVTILDTLRPLDEESYLFILGCNQDVLPKIHKDLDYINDSLKEEVSLYSSSYKNKLERDYLEIVLSNTKNVILSYKKESNFQEYLKSSILSDLELEEVEYSLKVSSSPSYNQLLLGKMLDNYYKYGEESPYLKPLYQTYQEIPYKTYRNTFTKINHSNYLNYIGNKLTLSYTSFNRYQLCKFSYYIKYVLKLDLFRDNFNTLVGNLFHYMFSVCYLHYFNFEREWDHYLEKLELSDKDLFFLNILKEELKKDIEVLRNQEEYTTYTDKLYEKKLNVDIPQYLKTTLTGNIDKIMYKEESGETLLSIIDYKTGTPHTNIYNMKYGLDMQLPIYLFLVYYSNLFSNIKFSGIYLQKVLNDQPKYKKNLDVDEEFKKNLKLNGYTTNLQERLCLFDKTYEKSEYIKGMKITSKEEFDVRAKLLSDEDFTNIIEYTKKLLLKGSKEILEGDFEINPKVMDHKNLACENCKYQDLCFKTSDDESTLEKQKDLSFLGGDRNG